MTSGKTAPGWPRWRRIRNEPVNHAWILWGSREEEDVPEDDISLSLLILLLLLLWLSIKYHDMFSINSIVSITKKYFP